MLSVSQTLVPLRIGSSAPREIEKGAFGREVGVDQRGEGEADQHLQPVAGRLEEHVDLDVGQGCRGRRRVGASDNAIAPSEGGDQRH